MGLLEYYRFGVEDGVPWRNVISTRYGGGENDLLPANRNHKKFLGLLKAIMKPLVESSETSNSFHVGLELCKIMMSGFLVGVEIAFSLGYMSCM